MSTAIERTSVKPILFSGPMVRALLDGRKTQTRRVLKPQPPKDELGYEVIGTVRGPEWYHPAVVGKDGELEPGKQVWGVYDDYGEWGARVPYMPGDLLWVRERWSDELLAPGEVYYYATALEDGLRADEVAEIRWKPSIHMPRWASRLTLEVTAVKVERLQEISQEDARAEGVATEEWDDWRENVTSIAMPEGSYIENERDLFRDLWDSLNAERGFGWDTNPWVCATSFIVHRMNIDDFLAQREA